ncbi:MAG: peptide chain release factor 2 [Verrucomicrobiae bacterium]|nr:peptide chain release factor 2 [Verrucomicrobiae bacterium]
MPKLRSELERVESRMAAPDFWNQPGQAKKVINESKTLKSKLEPLGRLESKIGDLQAYIELFDAEADAGQREKLLSEFKADLAKTREDFRQFELAALLHQAEDRNNAILSLHAGAGGTESCDWADILFRMFRRWCERHDFELEVLDVLPGEGAGIKSSTFIVKGLNAYGFLKAERGVHRLVRISPFDANARRHTSFASLDVLAELEDEGEVEILDKDLKIDTYRSSGAGGQHVNKTDSAVRMTHLPTGIVVTCQNERSQIKNRATAMKIMKAKLREMEMDKKRAELEKHYSEKGDIGWGHQIRSYVMQPYQLVKDHRTGEQTSNVQAVLDGELDPFIEAFLKGKKATKGEEIPA